MRLWVFVALFSFEKRPLSGIINVSETSRKTVEKHLRDLQMVELKDTITELNKIIPSQLELLAESDCP